jgi:V-type H+-transporting ATPase subunit C
MSNNYWFVTLPSDPQDKDFNKLKSSLINDGSKINQIGIPDFIVGNLDSLISLSDELNKSNTSVESVLRKIERQYLDVASTGSSSAEKLRINGCDVEKYLSGFKWDPTNYPFHSKPLQEICASVLNMASRVDEELKRKSTSYSEKSQNYAALQRRKAVNMTTSDFEDFLSPEAVAKLRIRDSAQSEYLQPLMVVVPRALSDQFEKEYASIGNNIACGGPKWAGRENQVGSNDGHFGTNAGRSQKISPVVPNSLKLAFDDAKLDSKLYLIYSLKGHYTSGGLQTVDGVTTFVDGNFTEYLKPLKEAFREQKYHIREFSYNVEASKAGGLDNLISIAKQEIDEAQVSLSKWCATNFGQVYSGWIHLRVIKAFAESVLRYGLPAGPSNLSVFIISPNQKREAQIKDQLLQIVARVRPHLIPKKSVLEEDDEEDLETLPFVCQKFAAIGI